MAKKSQASGGESRPGIEIPTRVLAIASAAVKKDEESKYALHHIIIETYDDMHNVAVATDGRRLVVARWKRAIYDTISSMMMPSSIAKAALKLSPIAKEGSEQPVAAIDQTSDGFSMKIDTIDGEVDFSFGSFEQAAVPWRSIIPTFDDVAATTRIGIRPDLMAGLMKIVCDVLTKDATATMCIRESATRAIGMYASDGDVELFILLMPCKAHANDIPWSSLRDSSNPIDLADIAPEPTHAATEEGWRGHAITALTADGITAKQCDKLIEAGIETLGQLQTCMASKATHWADDIKGIGVEARTKIDDAINALLVGEAGSAE